MKLYALIDTETTGLDPQKNQLLEVGIIVFNEDLKSCDFEVIPIKHKECVVSAKAMEVNGIDLIEHEKTAYDENQACDMILNFLSNVEYDQKYIFAGQNCPFDRAFIEEMFKRNGKIKEWNSLVDYHSLDLMGLAIGESLKGNLQFDDYKLDTISSALNVPKPADFKYLNSDDVVIHTNRHRALYDCLLELNCIQAICGKELTTPERLNEGIFQLREFDELTYQLEQEGIAERDR